MANGFLVPRSTQALIYAEREKMLNNVVRLIGRLSEEVIGGMNGGGNGSAQACESGEQSLDVEKVVERVIEQKFASVLHDIDYRIKVLYDAADRLSGAGDKVGSRDLNLAHHLLDGFTFTNNSPSAGYVAWAGCHIVYKGTNYTITDGNTNSKYIYWAFATPTVFSTSATKPSLGVDDCLIGVNDGGTFYPAIVPGKLYHGSTFVNGTVGTNEIAALAVTTGLLADGAVSTAKIASGAVGSGQIAAGAVGTTQLADGSITTAKIGAGQVATDRLNLAEHLLY